MATHKYKKEFKAIIIKKIKIAYSDEDDKIINMIVRAHLISFLNFINNKKGHYSFNEYSLMLNEILDQD
jgi:hypothetical protein